MTSQDIGTAQKAIAAVIALVAGAVAILLVGWLYLILGVLTHVIAICSDAHRWWEITYDCLAVLILVAGAAAGWITYRLYAAYLRRKMFATDENEAEPVASNGVQPAS